jgi:maltooligosyltrehalose trehalohydrolase
LAPRNKWFIAPADLHVDRFQTKYFKTRDVVKEEIICGTAEVERIAERIRAQQTRPQPGQVMTRRFPIGAKVVAGGGVDFRVWAPRAKSVAVELWPSNTPQGNQEAASDRAIHPLVPEEAGYFRGHVQTARAGMLYQFRTDAGSFPDPASRFQPEGPHGPSQIVDPASFQWTDRNWRGVSREGQVIYEMHIGAFTPEGTWRAAMEQLPELARLGITTLEVMPVADFCGKFGWGYDGVNMFAPARLYGSPDDLRAFVNRAHEVGLGVILDVVYNHFGPDGNYLGHFSRDYFSERYKNEWGEPINFDDKNPGPVREFFLANAAYWIEEFHMDGLRLDATQQIFDSSPTHILTEIGRAVREAGRGRATYLVNENERQHTRLVRHPDDGGYGLDALWNDDFHHTARVALTGRNEAYYTDYKGTPQEFISAIKWGYLFQGQWYKWQGQRRGTPALDLGPESFVNFIQNHDQIANSLHGHRIHQLTSPGRFKAITTLLLLAPQTPMLFMGQEFAASAPFLYFADHNPDLAKRVAQGRAEFLKQFKSFACPECEGIQNNPESEKTFRQCILDFSEREENREIYDLHRDLLKLRREHPVFAKPRKRGVDGAVLGSEAFVLRYFAGEAGDSASGDNQERLLVVNLGSDLNLNPAPEPLLAPPRGFCWKTIFSTESAIYGGGGTPPIESEENWWLPGHAAVVLAPQRMEDWERGSDGETGS